jgi:hypothetical protein
MKIATLVVLAATILLSPATLLPQQGSRRDVPAELDTARTALKGAYDDLQHAGGEWGGNRGKAMQHIQQAITDLNEAERWAREHKEIR